MKAICDIPLESIESVEIFVKQFRYSMEQISAQAYAVRASAVPSWEADSLR